MTTQTEPIATTHILKVYSGRSGKCMCGCSGKYYVPAARLVEASEERGYAYDDDDISDRMVAKVARILTAARDAGTLHTSDRPSRGVTWAEAIVGNRTYVAYFK